MALEVRRTAGGWEAVQALVAALTAAKAGDPLAPATVVVPSNHVGVATRRLLASGRAGSIVGEGRGIAAVGFMTVYRLAELLGASAVAASGRRPVSTPVLAAAMRAELSADPGLFAPVAEHPATESALVATYRELRDLSPAALDALAATSARAGEVVRLHRSVRARLTAAWSDEEDLLDAAAGVVAEQGVGELGAVVVYLPQRLSQHGARLLQAIAERAPTTVVAGLTGIGPADAEVLTSLERLGASAEPAPARPLPVAVDRTTILTASDADEEVRAAVRAVLDSVRAGTRLDRIALLHASPEPYARLAHEQLRAAGLRTNGGAVVPQAARTSGRTLLDLLHLPDGRFRRQDVFAWLSSAPILDRGRWAPTTAWERLSREAAVVQDRHDWDHHLEQLAQRYDEEATLAEKDADEPAWVAEQRRAGAARARSLRAFVLGVIDDLGRAAATARPWSEHASWARRRLHRFLGDEALRDAWPHDERRSAEQLERSLDRLAALDAVEGPVTLAVFRRTLELELEGDLGRVGRFGDGVLVGSVEMGIGLDLDLVVVLGLAEGLFPGTVRDDSLLPDRERQATGGEVALRTDRVERQHRHLVAALAGASRQLLCVPRGDLRRSVERVPSRWVLDVAGQLAADGRRWWGEDLVRADAPWIERVASFDAGLRAASTPATEQEHRLRSLLATGGDLAATDDELTRSGGEVIASRRSDRFTRFDGNLEAVAVPSPLDHITSPSRLERWAGCPHRHLVEDILRAAPVENPEEALMITPTERGKLVHEALERFLLEVLERPEAQRPRGPDAWTDADRSLLLQIGAALCDQAEARGLTGRSIFWKRDRRQILGDLLRFVEEDADRLRGRAARAMGAELGFGFDEGVDAVVLPLPDGRELRVRGRIDRVDLGGDGTVLVLDYKTGSSRQYDGLADGDPVAAGTRLQLPIYGLAGRVAARDQTARVRAEYWFVSSRYGFERIGYDVTDAVLERTAEVVQDIVTGIEAGVFPPHPEALSTYLWITCHVCNPDGLGTAELRKQWERKRHDPRLARYAELAEPSSPELGEDVG